MIQGTCHCSAVSWQFKGLPESATACDCTVCRRYGVLWAYDREGEGITVSVPIAKLPIDHFDGLNTFDDLPRGARCVGDLWF